MRMLFDGLRTLLYVSAFFVVFVWIAFELRRYDPALRFALPKSLVIVGAALMIAGAALALTCVSTFVVKGRGTPALFDPPRQFVAVGPYRHVRNPMYIGGFALLLGLSLYLRSISILLMVLTVVLACHLLVVFYEEPTLRRKFGGAYEVYCLSVARWLPRLHRAGGRFDSRLTAR